MRRLIRDPLNFFEPYESLPPTHENQPTRAFLVVLKLVPIAHAVWLRMVSDADEGGAKPLPPLERLPTASFLRNVLAWEFRPLKPSSPR